MLSPHAKQWVSLTAFSGKSRYPLMNPVTKLHIGFLLFLPLQKGHIIRSTLSFSLLTSETENCESSLFKSTFPAFFRIDAPEYTPSSSIVFRE